MYPTFASQYTSEKVPNNSLIVECGDRSRFISYSDIYLTEGNMSTYSYDTSFDGEGAITSAIDYVVSEELPQLYILEGHGEAELSQVFRDQIERENLETTTFSLLNKDSVPEEADCVLIYGPTSDISTEEKEMLSEYITGGGKLMVLAGPLEENYYAIMPIAQGLTVRNTSGVVTELLTTSETAYSKAAGYDISTYEKEEGDIDGPFALAVSIDCGNEGQIVWFTSSNLLDDMYNSYSSGANLDLGMNALSSLMGEREAVAIRSKYLNYNYLTISESTASFLKLLMIGGFPLAFLGAGICTIVGRRRRQNEPV